METMLPNSELGGITHFFSDKLMMKTDPDYAIFLHPNPVPGEQKRGQRWSSWPGMVREGFTKATGFELALWEKSLLQIVKGESGRVTHRLRARVSRPAGCRKQGLRAPGWSAIVVGSRLPMRWGLQTQCELFQRKAQCGREVGERYAS